MELTQNNVLNVDSKPGSANRLAPLSSDYSERFRRWRQMLSFRRFRGGVNPQDDVIINHDLGVLVSTQNPIRQHSRHFEFQKW